MLDGNGGVYPGDNFLEAGIIEKRLKNEILTLPTPGGISPIP